MFNVVGHISSANGKNSFKIGQTQSDILKLISKLTAIKDTKAYRGIRRMIQQGFGAVNVDHGDGTY